MKTAAELEWGPTWIDVAAPAIWGARGIVKDQALRVLHDRKCVIGEEGEGRLVRVTMDANWASVSAWARKAHGEEVPRWGWLGEIPEGLVLCASAGPRGGKTGYVHLLACRPQLAPHANLEWLKSIKEKPCG